MPNGPVVATSDPVASACHSCGALLHGPFCAACGQEAKPLNPRLRDVLRDLVQELLDMDGRMFRSVRRLFLSPGFLTREQFRGRRQPWLSPIRLYLVFSVLYFGVAAVTDTSMRINITGKGADGKRTENVEETRAGVQGLGFDSEQELVLAVRAAFTTWMPRVMFLLVPLFAGLVALVRRRSGLSYPQHVYFALHVHAAWFGMLAFGTAVGALEVPYLGPALTVTGQLLAPVYLVAALHVAYAIRKRRAVLDGAVVLFIYAFAFLGALGSILWAVFRHHL